MEVSAELSKELYTAIHNLTCHVRLFLGGMRFDTEGETVFHNSDIVYLRRYNQLLHDVSDMETYNDHEKTIKRVSLFIIEANNISHYFRHDATSGIPLR